LENLQRNLVKTLILEIRSFLDDLVSNEGETEILKILRSIPLKEKNYNYQNHITPPKEKALLKAISYITEESLYPIKNAIFLASKQLKWNIDNGSFYEKGSGIGKNYLNGNMNTELIGPKNGVFKSDDFRMGLFLLEPNIFYKDHKHEAPELYLNLSNGTQWRFGNANWIDQKAGSIIYNEPYRVHAMKVNDQPFLSVWCWPYNSLKKCIVVPGTKKYY
tara:strand:- start:342 stop:998 length:657 start_codon:yes stop_codon:yes gene_type:complete